MTYVIKDSSLSKLALKLFSVVEFFTSNGKSFQIGITMFRKNSSRTLFIFALSLCKQKTFFLKFPAGPESLPQSILFRWFSHFILSIWFIILQNCIKSPLFRLISKVVSFNAFNLYSYDLVFNFGTKLFPKYLYLF